MTHCFPHIIIWSLPQLYMVIPSRGIVFLTDGNIKTQVLRGLLCVVGPISIKAGTQGRAQVSECPGQPSNPPRGLHVGTRLGFLGPRGLWGGPGARRGQTGQCSRPCSHPSTTTTHHVPPYNHKPIFYTAVKGSNGRSGCGGKWVLF